MEASHFALAPPHHHCSRAQWQVPVIAFGDPHVSEIDTGQQEDAGGYPSAVARYSLGTAWVQLEYRLGTAWVLIGYSLGIAWMMFGYGLGTAWVVLRY